jgi:hypothetical protein
VNETMPLYLALTTPRSVARVLLTAPLTGVRIDVVVGATVKDSLVTHLDANQACREFTDTLERVSLGKERIVLQTQGKDVAVLVPIEDLSLLEQLEDAADIKAAEAAEAEAAARSETPIPWKEARRQLGP